jgi:hypothetical protein
MKKLMLMLMVGLLLCAAVTQAELLSNRSFEDDVDDNGEPDSWGGGVAWYWSYYGTATRAYVEGDAAGAYDGDDYVVIDATAGGNWSFSYAWYSQNFTNVVEGAEYSLSAYVRMNSEPAVQPALKIQWHTGPPTGANNIPPHITVEFPDVPKDGQWHKISMSAVAPAGATWALAGLFGSSDVMDGGSGVDVAECYYDLASFKVRAATDPDPADDSVVDHTAQTTLSWTNPDPKVSGPLTSDVYFLESATSLGDPNFAGFIALGPALLADNTTAESVAIAPALQDNKFYYWAVEVTDPNTGGSPYQLAASVWSFATGDDPAVPDAGADQYDGLDGGSAIVDLNGLVDDDGASPVTTLWSVDDPNVTITSPTSLVTTATVALTGSYTITLTATDGTGSLDDAMVANVYDDACAAAIGDPAQTLAGDISGPSGDSDCVVNLYDFAAMAIDWLECASAKLGCTP